MKKSKKFVLAGLVLLAAITMVLLPLAGCKTEVDIPDSQPCSHQPEADDGDCTTEVKCTLCDEVTTPGRSHDPNEDDGNCLTEVKCNNCDVVTTEAREAHEGGTPTCIGQACEVCGTFYGDKDENNHIKTSEVAYYYTWSETAPTSTKNYTCLHCGKAIEETASPSVWSVGDKVTYVAKDGNSYVSTVGEVTDGKAVLVSDEQWSTGKRTISKEELLAIVETKGARVPTLTEAVWTNIFEPWAYTTLPISYGGNADKTISVVYSSDVLSVVVNKETYLGIYNSTINLYFSKKNTWVGRYVWDVEFTTAE